MSGMKIWQSRPHQSLLQTTKRLAVLAVHERVQLEPRMRFSVPSSSPTSKSIDLSIKLLFELSSLLFSNLFYSKSVK